MEYSSAIQIDSKSCPGITFSILKMTYWRRAELRDKQAEARARLEAVQEQMAPLSKEYRAAVDAAKAAAQVERDKAVAIGMSAEDVAEKIPVAIDFPDEKFQRLVKYSDQIRQIDVAELTPIALLYAVTGIEGLKIDGEPATLKLLRERGPDALYDEISSAVLAEIELSPEERENLSSPSTSAAAVDGEKKAGSAALAGTPDTTMNGGAPSFMVLVNAGALGTGPVS